MNQKIENIRRTIISKVKKLTDTSAFSEWFKQQNASEGDIIVINNSFIYRDNRLIKTTKNEQYLCIMVKNKMADPNNVYVSKSSEQNSDFKLFSAKSSNLPSLESLNDALQRELNQLGRLIFVLIGKLQDVPTSVPVNHKLVSELRFETSAQNIAIVKDTEDGKKTIIVNQITDPETAWNTIISKLQQEGSDDLSSLETAFGKAFEELREEAKLELILPKPGDPRTNTSFIARLRESVSEQCKLYKAALQQYAGGDSTTDGHLRDAMRIAYNFADDAIKVLQLLISIADLKGILLWCTIKEHFDLAEVFRNLPWTKSHKKPSLGRYKEIISGARNRAFHNLLAFDRTIEADLSSVAVKARRLTILPTHSRRNKTVYFDYEDREMVEILTTLTRALEVAVPLDFWKRNVHVMEAFEKLLESTENALWMLNSV